MTTDSKDAKRRPDGTFKSGNPAINLKGRPRGSKNFATIVRSVLDEMVPVVKGGKRKKVAVKEALVRSMIVKALTPPGDLASMTKVLQYLVQSEEAALKAREPDYPFTEADLEVIGEIYARMKSCQAPKTS